MKPSHQYILFVATINSYFSLLKICSVLSGAFDLKVSIC